MFNNAQSYSQRRRANPRKDRRVFSHTADRSNSMNLRARPMRGGFRL